IISRRALDQKTRADILLSLTRELNAPRRKKAAAAALESIARGALEPSLRNQAIRALVEIQDPEIIDPEIISLLHHLLADPDPEIQAEAITGLVKLGDPKIQSALPSLARSEALEVRLAALVAWTKTTGIKEAVGALKRFV